MNPIDAIADIIHAIILAIVYIVTRKPETEGSIDPLPPVVRQRRVYRKPAALRGPSGTDETRQIITLSIALGNADAAIIVWTFQQWIAANKAQNSVYHFHDGRWWVYTGIGHLSADHFPWISEPKMARLLAQLDKDGILLRKRFVIDMPSPHYWYSTDEEAIARRIASAITSPTPSRRIFYGDALPWGIREYEDGAEFPNQMDEARILDGSPESTPQRIEGYVYLLQAKTGLYKIGMSTDTERRLRNFEGLPFDVSYVCVIESPDMRRLEAFLHKRFAAKRVKGEWFDLNADDVDYIQSLVLGGV